MRFEQGLKNVSRHLGLENTAGRTLALHTEDPDLIPDNPRIVRSVTPEHGRMWPKNKKIILASRVRHSLERLPLQCMDLSSNPRYPTCAKHNPSSKIPLLGAARDSQPQHSRCL